MITFFNISGAMIYLDEHGRQTAYEDVWTKIDMCREHYADCGLGAAFAEQFIGDPACPCRRGFSLTRRVRES